MSEAADKSEQERLKRFLKRRHPDYARLVAHWDFCEETYNGGREWFTSTNLHQYFKEGNDEYKKRIERAYRFNHTRETTDLVQKYIFKSPIARNDADAPQEIKDFWANATLSGLDISQFMKMVSTRASIFGRPWVFVDNTKTDEVQSVADAKKARVRCYAYIVKPQDILDVGFNDQGDILWVLVRELSRDDKNPIDASGDMIERFRLWTHTEWRLYEIIQDEVADDKTRVVEVGRGEHKLGRVPGFPVDHVVTDSMYSSPALIADIAYLDKACANYLSNLDAIIQDQTFSQLAIPAQGLTNESNGYEKIVEMGTKRIFTYDGEGGAKPEFLSPDPRQVQVIITVINKIINEIYHTIGMAGERTKQDNAVGIDNSSGVAKAYDFERMNSLLTAKADSLENCENSLVTLVLAWNNQRPLPKELVKYPDTFDTRSLFDEFTIAEKLALIDAPAEVRQEQMKQVIDKMFPRLAEDLKKKLHAALLEWPVDPVERAAALAEATAPPTDFASPKPKASKAKSRQGQVTKDTK